MDNPNSWIMPYATDLSERLTQNNHDLYLVDNQSKIEHCEIAFYLGCTSIVKREVMDLSNSNVVVHPSALPKGRGFSSLAWQILEGKNIITVTLFEASESVDEGDIYFTDNIHLNGTELNNEIKEQQGNVTVGLCLKYVEYYNMREPKIQKGDVSYYRRRTEIDSQLDPYKTIAEQFNLLRVVDNKRYPAFFNYNDCDYIIEIRKK